MLGEIPPIDNTPMNPEENANPRESQIIPPPEAILGVSIEEAGISESPTTPEILDEHAKRTIGYINTLAEYNKKRLLAETDFHGSRQGGGLKNERADLESRKTYLASVDERILNPEELSRYREEKNRVNQILSRVAPDEEYAKEFVNNAGNSINTLIESSLNDFEALPEELQGAIRTENQTIFKKYGVDSRAARQINFALKAREQEDEVIRRKSEHHIQGLLERKKAGKTTWQDVASVIDTPNLALFSGVEIKKVLMEQGITEDGIRILRERYQAETKKQEYKPDTLVVAPATETPRVHAVSSATLLGTEKTPNLSGVYLEGESNQVYDAKTGNPVDVTPRTPLGGAEVDGSGIGSTEYRPTHSIIRAEDGVVTFDSALERNYVGELNHALSKAGVPQKIAYAPFVVKTNPALSGVYELGTDGSVQGENGENIVQNEVTLAMNATVAQKESPSATDPFAIIEAEAEKIIKETTPVSRPSPSPLSAASLLEPLPREAYVHETPDVDNRIPEQLRADWREHGVNLKPGATAAHLATTVRSVLGARGIEGIERNEREVAETIRAQAAKVAIAVNTESPAIIAPEQVQESAVSNAPEITVQEVSTPLASPRTLEIVAPTVVEKTQEEIRLEEIASHEQNWVNLSDAERNSISAGIIKLYGNKGQLPLVNVKRTSGATEVWTFGGIRPSGKDVQVFSGNSIKSVPILEFIAMNAPLLLDEAIDEQTSSTQSENVPSEEAEEPLSPYDLALDNVWLHRDEHINAPEWALEPIERERNAKELNELDEVGTLWGSFIAREYGLDVNGNKIVEPTEAEVTKRVNDLEVLPTANPVASEPLPRDATLHHAVTKQFAEKFNIDERALEKIPAFASLSAGKQLLVLRNLEQLTLAGVTEEAKNKQRAEWGGMNVFQRGGQMLFSLGMEPELRIAEIEKKILAEERGVDKSNPEAVRREAVKIAHIESLSKVALVGPNVKVKPEGGLDVEFCNPKEIFSALDDPFLTPERLRAVEEFNHASNEYAAIPHEWKYKTTELLGRERAQYEATKYAFQTSGARVAQIMKEKFVAEGDKMPDERAMLAMNKFEERVELSQLFNTHPDAEKALGRISDTSTILRAGKEFWKAKGNFIAYGIAGRAAAVALVGPLAMGAVGAALIAGGAGVVGYGVGMGIGTEEAKRVMKERRARGRMSEDDEREEVVYQKTKDGIPTGQTGTRRIKEFTDATFFTNRVEHLNEKLETTRDPKEKVLLEKKIAQTVSLMAVKLESGMINFGSSEDASDARMGASITNRLHFMQAIAEGAIATRVDRDAMDKEAERIVGLRGAKIEEVRKKEIAQIVSRSAMIRGLFALAGASIKPVLDIVAGPKVPIAPKVVTQQIETAVEKPKDYIVPKKIVSAPVAPTPTPLPKEEIISTPKAPVVPKAPTSGEVVRSTAPNPPVARVVEKSSAPVTLKPPRMSDADVPRPPRPDVAPRQEQQGLRQGIGTKPHTGAVIEGSMNGATPQEIMKSVTFYEKAIGRDLSGGEMLTVRSLRTLEANMGRSSVGDAEAGMITAMKAKGAPLSSAEIYDVLKKYNLHDTVVIPK